MTLFINRVPIHSFKLVSFLSCFDLVISYDFESLICISQERERDIIHARCAHRLLVGEKPLLVEQVDHMQIRAEARNAMPGRPPTYEVFLTSTS